MSAAVHVQPLRRHGRAHTTRAQRQPSLAATTHPFPAAHRSKARRTRIKCFATAGVPPSPSSSWSTRLQDGSRVLVALLSVFRAFAFYVWTLALSVPLFLVMLVITPVVWRVDGVRRKALHWVNMVWANLSTWPFYRVNVEGERNLPPEGSPAVYVANHASYLDIFTLFSLWRGFKFVSKTSNFMIPIVGWSMFLTGHVPLKRTDARSMKEMLLTCRYMLREGAPVLIFPEGTRTSDGRMHAFKKGAFSVAAKAKVPVVPITLIGTGELMPNGSEGTLKFGEVRVIVHPPIEGKDADELAKQARAAIAAPLDPERVA